MIIGGSTMRAHVDYQRIVSIVGARGAGKDMLCHELAIPYLNDGYGFYSNQFSVWNDPLYVKLNPGTEMLYKRKKEVELFQWEGDQAYAVRRGVPAPVRDNLFSDVRWRVVILSEAGRYLRKYEYFEDLLEFARKLKMYFFFPSVRESHADLMEFVIYPVVPFKPLMGIEGGLWGWKLQSSHSRAKTGLFIFLPGSYVKGVYDTSDFTETPNVLLEAVRREVEVDQITRGRDGLQALGDFAKGVDVDHQAKIAARFEQYVISLSSKKR